MASHDSSEVRFADYVAALVGVIGHADRATPLRGYCTGLLMPAERKSVEPMAAITAPARVAAQHQSLLHSGAACDRARRAHRGLDHRRYRLPQEGPALGGGGAPVLRPARQAGQLPS